MPFWEVTTCWLLLSKLRSYQLAEFYYRSYHSYHKWFRGTHYAPVLTYRYSHWKLKQELQLLDFPCHTYTCDYLLWPFRLVLMIFLFNDYIFNFWPTATMKNEMKYKHVLNESVFNIFPYAKYNKWEERIYHHSFCKIAAV